MSCVLLSLFVEVAAGPWGALANAIRPEPGLVFGKPVMAGVVDGSVGAVAPGRDELHHGPPPLPTFECWGTIAFLQQESQGASRLD